MPIRRGEIRLPGGTITGEPGEVWVNDSERVMYQLKVTFQNSCALCIQYANAIGPWWPVPFHFSCNCKNIPIAPGEASEPFLDFIDEVRKLSRSQQKRIMGAANWRLVERGEVAWSDVVTRSRIRPAHEVVHRAKLTVEQLTDLGITERQAQRLIGLVQTPEKRARDAAAKAAVERLRELGLSRDEIREWAARRLARRFGIDGPSGPQRLRPSDPPPSGPTPPPKPKPRPTPPPKPEPPKFGPSKAKLRHLDIPKKEIERAIKDVLGSQAEESDLASITGATDDALIDVSTTDQFAGVTIQATIRGDGYRADRQIKRTMDGDLVIENTEFYVEPNRQGQGIGREVFGRQVETAARLGAKRIDTLAAGGPNQKDIGYIVWPRLGYDGPTPKEIREKLPPELADAERLSDLMATPEGRAWWTKNGRAVPLTFDLDAESLSRRVWDEYLRRKAGRAN